MCIVYTPITMRYFKSKERKVDKEAAIKLDWQVSLNADVTRAGEGLPPHGAWAHPAIDWDTQVRPDMDSPQIWLEDSIFALIQ